MSITKREIHSYSNIQLIEEYAMQNRILNKKSGKVMGWILEELCDRGLDISSVEINRIVDKYSY